MIREYYPELPDLSNEKRVVYFFLEIILLVHSSYKSGIYSLEKAYEYIYVSLTYEPMMKFMGREGITIEEIELLFNEIEALTKKNKSR